MATVFKDETQYEASLRLLRELFADRQRVLVSEAMAVANEAGISRTTFIRAKKALDIRVIHNGTHGGFWELRQAEDQT